jgi:hypothetical protein
MTPGPRDSSTSTDRRRLRMRPETAPPGVVDGGWWPRSEHLAEQLPAVLTELWDRLGGVERVVYNPESWADTAPRIAVRGRLVQLIGQQTQHPDTIVLISAVTRLATTLLVVPAGTSPIEAENALVTAARPGEARNISRFIESGVGTSGPGSPGRSGRDIGESFRARAAEERHTAAERANAVRTVAANAMDEADCRMLLSILGLDAGDGVQEP